MTGGIALPNRIGVGGIVYSDDTGGAIKRTGIELGGSYTIDLNNYDAVSFGLSDGNSGLSTMTSTSGTWKILC